MDAHWLLSEEFKWRTYTSLIWAWMVNFVILYAFLFFWVSNPWNHVYMIHEYFLHILSPRVDMLLIALASISIFYIPIFKYHFTVFPKISVSRYEMLRSMFQGKQLLLALCHGMLDVVVFVVISLLSTSKCSSPIVACSTTTTPENICINEYWLFLIMFSFCVGASNFVFNEKEQKYSLHFSSVQQTRILYLKCKFSSFLRNAVGSCLKTSRNFIIIYYFLGFIIRDLIAAVFGLNTSEIHVLSIFNLLGLIPVVWKMILLGTLLLLLHDVSWNMFNLCHTKRYNFMIDSVFPEDAKKLLTANFSGKQPKYVQHLAFQCLSHLTCNSASVRKQIFALHQGGVSSKSSKWNMIADECLLRINNFTQALTDHSLKYAGQLENDQKNASRLSSKSSTSSQSSTSDEKSPFLSVSTLRRRPLNSEGANSPNMSYFNVSTLDATTTNAASSPYRRGPNLVIPTPKLWTRQLYRASSTNLNDGEYPEGYGDKLPDEKKPLINSFVAGAEKWLKKFALVSYLIKKMPDRAAANLFSGRCVCKWALQSLSVLVEASFAEDDYGVVQRRLHEIIAALVELHVALEKYGKLPATSSSPSVAAMLREIRSVRSECKSAIYRITDTFGSHLDVISVAPEHRRKLRAFTDHKE